MGLGLGLRRGLGLGLGLGIRGARGAWGTLEAVALGMDPDRAAVGTALARQRRAAAFGTVLARPTGEALELFRHAVVLAGRAGGALVHAGPGRVAAGGARLGLGRARSASETSHALLALLGRSEVGGVAVGAPGAERGLRGTRLAELARRARQAGRLAARRLVLARRAGSTDGCRGVGHEVTRHARGGRRRADAARAAGRARVAVGLRLVASAVAEGALFAW